LLELLLFHSIERIDVKPLARALLAEFGSLSAVVAADPRRLLAHKRVSERTLALFKAVRETMRRLLREELAERPLISAWSQLLDYCRVSLAEEPTELFRVLYLDRKNRLIHDEPQQRGTVDHAPAYPREVLERAVELGARALILVHNHLLPDTVARGHRHHPRGQGRGGEARHRAARPCRRRPGRHGVAAGAGDDLTNAPSLATVTLSTTRNR
jgi:DNA repair protein RadC